MSWPIHFGINLISGLSANLRKRSGNGGNPVKRVQKVIGPEETHNVLGRVIWGPSDQRFVFKCNRPTRGHETVEIQWSVTKVNQSWGGPYWVGQMRGNCSNNQMQGSSGNYLEQNQKLIRSGGYRNECTHQVCYRSLGRFVRKCAEIKKCDGWTDERTDEQDPSYSPTHPYPPPTHPQQLRLRGTKIKPLYSRKWMLIWCLQNVGHFVSAAICSSSHCVAWCNQGAW